MASTSDLAIEDKRLLSRVEDAVTLCDKRGISRFIGFVDERQTALIKACLKKSFPHVIHAFYGGHDQAERVMLGIFADEISAETTMFPLVPIGFRYRSQATITHRDVLGSVLGCGIERDRIGDILIGDGLAVVFVTEELSTFIADTLTKISREGVTAECPYFGEIPALHRFSELNGTVASPRLDAVLKVLLGVSRDQAASLVMQDRVRLNHVSVDSVSASVHEGDVVSVTGYGRFVIDDLSDRSKKGRVILRARKYV